MDKSLQGYVVYENHHGAKPIRRFVEKKLRQWLGLQGISPEAIPLQYHVNFQREGQGHLVSCDVVIRTPQSTLKGNWTASGLHQSLQECLRHMTPRILSPATQSARYG